MYFQKETMDNLNEKEDYIYKLVQKDVLRTQPDCPLFRFETIKMMMVRILFTWHMRHPASGYV